MISRYHARYSEKLSPCYKISKLQDAAAFQQSLLHRCKSITTALCRFSKTSIHRVDRYSYRKPKMPGNPVLLFGSRHGANSYRQPKSPRNPACVESWALSLETLELSQRLLVALNSQNSRPVRVALQCLTAFLFIV